MARTVVSWGWLVLLAAAPFYLLPAAATTPALLLIPIAFWAQRFGTGRRSKSLADCASTPLDWPIFGLLVMLLVSLWATYSVAVSLVKVTGVLFGAGLYFALVAAAGSRCWRWPTWPVGLHLALGSGLALTGLLAVRWASPKIPGVAQLVAGLPDQRLAVPAVLSGVSPNEVAGVLLWVAPLALAHSCQFWLERRGLRSPRRFAPGYLVTGWLITLCALGLAVVLLLTQSRTGYLAMAGALGCMLWISLRTFRRRAAAVGFVLLVCVLLLFYGLSSAHPGPGQVEDSRQTTASGLASLAGRAQLWMRALQGLEDFGAIGMGMNTFRYQVRALYPLHASGDDSDVFHAHNLWLQVALDLGVPGLVCYLSIWLITVGLLVAALRRAARGYPRAHLTGLLGCHAGSLVFSLTDAVAVGARPGFLWWSLLALSVMAWHQAAHDTSNGQRLEEPRMVTNETPAIAPVAGREVESASEGVLSGN